MPVRAADLMWVNAPDAAPVYKKAMEPKASPAPNHKLRRYRERATHFWRLANSVSHKLARQVWASYASFWQEQAAKREEHLARHPAHLRDHD